VVDIAGRLVGVSSAKWHLRPRVFQHRDWGLPIPAETVREVVKGFKAVAQKKPSAQQPPSSSINPPRPNADRPFWNAIARSDGGN